MQVSGLVWSPGIWASSPLVGVWVSLCKGFIERRRSSSLKGWALVCLADFFRYWDSGQFLGMVEPVGWGTGGNGGPPLSSTMLARHALSVWRLLIEGGLRLMLVLVSFRWWCFSTVGLHSVCCDRCVYITTLANLSMSPSFPTISEVTVRFTNIAPVWSRLSKRNQDWETGKASSIFACHRLSMTLSSGLYRQQSSEIGWQLEASAGGFLGLWMDTTLVCFQINGTHPPRRIAVMTVASHAQATGSARRK